MIVPDHWAEARTTVRVKGRDMTLRRFGWSDASAADAQAQAELRVAEAAQRAARGENVPRRELKLTYNGAQGLPIREEVLARHGTAVITRNTYGARCLNVPDLLIADVDFSTRPPAVQRAGLQLLLVCVSLGVLFSLGVGVIGVIAAIGSYLLGSVVTHGLAGRRTDESEGRARGRIDAFLANRTDWRVRLYRTPAGLRLIETHARFAASGPQTQDFFKAIGADPLYARMCLNQHCFRARLSAKPWRIGIADHLKPRPGVWPVRPERLPAREAWVRRYEREAEAYAACRYVQTLGGGADDPDLLALVALHDAESKALDDIRPMA
ncbi:hypothetical protein ACG04R_00280 [Roseateles sp. BYS78W]|uniref:Transmembrane protein n=1 Tax=Pelomonas candidula TaxID=3299025 RepID=A0ABW7H5C4_9BURK